MKKLELNDPETKSADVVSENISALQSLFPDALREGKVDFDVLRQLLGDSVEDREEKYGLNWHGKRNARQIALTPSIGTLLPCPEEGVDWESSRNLMIEGDNLEVLKLLQKSYTNKVKLIYIDPPYNTGSDFVYPDNFRDGVSNYLSITKQVDDSGLKISSNSETSGRFHTRWMNMIYPRLKVARNFLQKDGFIVVSIDDDEVSNLRILMDEIFGSENHVATLVYDRNRKNDAKLFSVGHEYMVVYAKDKSLLKVMGTKLREPKEGIDEAREFYRSLRIQYGEDWEAIRAAWRSFHSALSDDDPRKKLGRFTKVGPRGPYRDDGDISWPGGGGPRYEVQHPLTQKPCKIPPGGWVYPTARGFWDAFDLGRVVFGDDETTLPRQIRYLFEGEGQVMPTVHYSYAQTATMNFVELMGERVFENPKNWYDISRMVGYLSGPNDTVMDFFAGSGTTGHAVMHRNAKEGSSRRYILIQLPEPILDDGGNSTAVGFLQKKAKKLNIAEITKERLRLSRQQVRNEISDYHGDDGFKVLKLEKSNLRAWNADPGNIENDLLANAEHILPGRTEEDILYELLLKLGLDLCVPIEGRQIAGKTVHAIGGGALIACLADGLTRDVVEALSAGIVAWWKELAPAVETRVVFKDSGFADDVAKTNMAAILNQNGILDVRSL